MYRYVPAGLMALSLLAGCADTGANRPPTPPALVSVSKVYLADAWTTRTSPAAPRPRSRSRSRRG